jgi:hypothetical protein
LERVCKERDAVTGGLFEAKVTTEKMKKRPSNACGLQSRSGLIPTAAMRAELDFLSGWLAS